MSDEDDLRIGTQEREAAIAILGEHLARGRLEITEYEQRAGAAAAARTRAELRPLFADLPPPHPTFLLGPAPSPAPAPASAPRDPRSTLAEEGVVLIAENLRGWITYRRYRAPGSYSSWRKAMIMGTVALTHHRLLVWSGRTKHVDVPFNHPLRSAIEVSVDKPNRLTIAVDVSAFHNDRSGEIELRFKTPLATQIADVFGSRR
jgi:Domain of unknown function (DUF1707)